jgi:apolipoprotein N-acyltransferase
MNMPRQSSSDRRPPLRLPRDVWSGAALSGVLLATATAQVGFGLLCFVALVPLLAAIDAGATPRRAAAAGWLCGIVFFGSALAWVPLSGFGGSLLAVAAAYVVVMGLSLAAYSATLAWLRQRDRWLCLALAPVLWAAVEFARSWGALGYPWHHLGYALASYPPLIQLAGVGGLYALSLWIAGVNTLVVGLRGAPRRAVLLSGALVAAPLALGLRTPELTEPAETARVAAVQPHIAAPGRTDPARFQANLRTLLDLTDEALRGEPDLIVWPESAYERPIHAEGDPFLGAIAHHYGTPILTGAWRVERDTPQRVYNSATLVSSEGEGVLAGDKVHPVPFYEGTPATPLERLMARFLRWPGRFRQGERPGIAWIERAGAAPLPVGVVICLDSSYPGLVRELRQRGARLLVEISNEALTGEWSAVQHALVTRMRAVESGLPVVRVGNSGPSEWIDPSARVIARLMPGAAAAGTATLRLARPTPPYVFLGDGPTFAVGLIPAFVLLASRRRAGSTHRARRLAHRSLEKETCS